MDDFFHDLMLKIYFRMEKRRQEFNALSDEDKRSYEAMRDSTATICSIVFCIAAALLLNPKKPELTLVVLVLGASFLIWLSEALPYFIFINQD